MKNLRKFFGTFFLMVVILLITQFATNGSIHITGKYILALAVGATVGTFISLAIMHFAKPQSK